MVLTIELTSVLRSRDGKAIDRHYKFVEAQRHHQHGCYIEIGVPEVEGSQVVEFHEDNRAEDDNGRGDDEDDRGHGQILLVPSGATLH